ncbi:universal stress protein [Actinokineospora sp. HUAS TT18]|uniref:universal stress protein n=1 Tax=Actinokineospora sp. HUAS TT18 TaxID=3447451 RepID=UPI003F51CDD3
MTTPTIVVGIDGSDRSRTALRWAMEAARDRGATVRAIQVQAPVQAFVPASSMGFNPYGEPHRPSTAADLTALVDDVTARVAEPPEVVTAVIDGRVGADLARAAAGADLLVIGAHHSAPHLASGVGGFATGVVRHATCPVVIVPA